MNLVQSYHDFVSAHSSLDGEPPTGPMEIVIPFGDHRLVHGTEEFPQLILEHWNEVLEANPINKETIPSFLLRPPEPKWSKAMHDATVRAWTDFGSLKDGTGEEGISKFFSLLPSCVGMYQRFHEHHSTHFNGTTCHCPLSEEFAPTWNKLLPDIELPLCRKKCCWYTDRGPSLLGTGR